MKTIRSCTFIGHRNCPSEIIRDLSFTIETLITKEQVTCFYVGTQGGFDRLVYRVLCDLEKKHEIQIFVVLAYLNKKNEYYDSKKTIFPDELTKTPFRFAIRRRNQFMINRSDYVVSYIDTPYSNAYRNIEEAIKKKKHMINLGKYDFDQIAK